MNNEYDVIISGAGPSGLAAAFYLGREEFKVLIIEKNSTSGAFPRAETLRDNVILDDFLGEGFMKSISLNETAARRFNSPGAKKNFLVYRKKASYLFDWHKMINRMETRAKEFGAEIMFNSVVKAPLIENGICKGVILEDGRIFRSNTVFACDGYSSPLGTISGVDYSRMNCPIAKKVVADVPFDFEGMEFFFVAEHSLDFAPKFPAAILFIFPRGNHEVETGLMVMSAAYLKKHLASDLPTEEETQLVLNQLMINYPGYSDKLKDGKILFQGKSTIPLAGMFHKIMTIPGLVLSGDAIGFIEASGGCGIVSSIKSVKIASEFLSKNKNISWDSLLMDQLNRDFTSSDIYKHIAKVHKVVDVVLNFFFATLKTPKRINRHWKIIRFFYRLG